MSLHTYDNPPVHEVILDVLNHDSVDFSRLEGIVREFGSRYSLTEPIASVEMLVSVGFEGKATPSATSELQGFNLRSPGSDLVLQLMRNRFSLHCIRSQSWPKGHYRGWVSIAEEFAAILPTLALVYDAQTIRRAGLRYLNRIAVPRGKSIDEWLAVGFDGPAGLQGIVNLNLHQSWERVESHPELGASLGLARINVDDPDLGKDHDGLLLDIDVFNYWVAKAPEFKGLAGWFDMAHEVENQIFESCVTDSLRAAFGGVHVNAS